MKHVIKDGWALRTRDERWWYTGFATKSSIIDDGRPITFRVFDEKHEAVAVAAALNADCDVRLEHGGWVPTKVKITKHMAPHYELKIG